MSEVAAAPAAPVAAPQPAAKPAPVLYDHPLIPKPRQTQAAPAPLATSPVPVAAPPEPAPVAEPEAAPIEAKAEPEATEQQSDPDMFEYFPDDTFEVVVDGKKSEVTLQKLLASYQRNESSNQRFTEAKRMEQNAKSLVERMLTPEGFADACRAMNVDPTAIADKIVLQAWEYERMSPVQREMHDYRRERQTYEAQQKQQQQQSEAQRIQQETQAFQSRFLATTTSEMDRLRVPADPDIRNELVSRTAAHFKADLEAGYANATPAESLALVWDEYRTRLEAHARVAGTQGKPQPTKADQEKAAAQARIKAAQVAQQAPRSQPAVERDEQGRYTRRPGMDWTGIAVPKR